MSIPSKETKRINDYLGRKLSEGKLILFTGSGVSSDAKDLKGHNLPTSEKLAEELANLINVKYSNRDSLKDIFHLAITRKRIETTKYLKNRLNVDQNSLCDEYKILINQPWYKAYTINIDNLFSIAQMKFNFERQISCVSNNIHNQKYSKKSPADLIVTYLHGMLEDIPDNITFSQEQYSERTIITDAHYSILSSEILQYPFLFLGSQLDESLFWHYIHLRKRKGAMRNLREFRPNSFIIVPELSIVRQNLLKEYNITWIPQTWKKFCEDFLVPLNSESRKGFIKIKQYSTESIINTVPIVSDLITLNNKQTPKQYLLGAEPSWRDIHLSIGRDKEKEWINKIHTTMNSKGQDVTPIFILTGTAGDGKTSIAMKTALNLTNNNHIVGWIDRNSNIEPRKICQIIENTEHLECLFIDTPDVYGPSFSQIISQLASNNNKLKIIYLIVRSTKIDQVTKLLNSSIPIDEFNTYRLTDNEINKILDLLEDQNLIGNLKEKPREEQISIFKSKADRQLIVAMIEATSGKKFEEKICEEFENLEGNFQQIYCLVAVATSRNHYLLREEILLGMGEDRNNEIMNIIEQLARRGLFIENTHGGLQVRHRLIAQKVSDRLSKNKQLFLYYNRLAYIASIKSIEQTSEQKRMKRLLKTVINHEFLFKICSDIQEVQDLYEAIEGWLNNNHHFWLQRGCFELENGLLSLARNYLSQSSNLNPNDPLVKISLEHLNFKEALTDPKAEKAFRLADEAYNNIVLIIEERGKIDPYPYHILGTQGYSWAKREVKPTQRKQYLEDLLSIVKQGFEHHPRSREIKSIRDKIQTEILHFFVKN